MLLLIQVLIIFVLGCILVCVYVDELQDMKRGAPHAVVKEIWLGKERRKAIRINLNLDAVYSHPPNTKSRGTKKTYIENISMGGAKIQLEEKLKKGDPLLLEIKLPNTTRPIIANAETRWVADIPKALASGRRSFGTGVEFTYLKPTEKQELSNFIKSALASQ